jgi:hypothetical protein
MFKTITIPFDRQQKGFDDELLNRFTDGRSVLVVSRRLPCSG